VVKNIPVLVNAGGAEIDATAMVVAQAFAVVANLSGIVLSWVSLDIVHGWLWALFAVTQDAFTLMSHDFLLVGPLPAALSAAAKVLILSGGNCPNSHANFSAIGVSSRRES
jgi:hypothetical protein